jgi:4'-phosphopantetheinyl transferase EntD
MFSGVRGSSRASKPALFKCLNPVTGERFYYADACVCASDITTGTLQVRLQRDLSARFPAGSVLSGRFEVAEPYLHTAWMARRTVDL